MTRYYPRPGIAHLPVTDMEALPYGLLWRGDAENDMIRALTQPVRERDRCRAGPLRCRAGT